MVVPKHLSAGDILLYEYFSSKRPPPFLQRNLIRALRVHQHILTHGDTTNFPEEDFHSRRHWKPPAWDRLDEMVQRANACEPLVLELLRLVPLGRGGPSRAEDHKRQVKKPRPASLAQCTFHLTVRCGKTECVSVDREAFLGKSGTQDRAVSLNTERIVINREDLFSRDSVKPRLSLALNFGSETDSKNVYDYMGLDKVDAANTWLEARPHNNPDMPLEEITLRLTDHANEPILGLVVRMGCVKSAVADASLLEAMNRTQSKMSSKKSSRSTGISDHPIYRIIYIWPNDNGRQKNVQGMKCYNPRCGRAMATLEECLMHLQNSHPTHDHVCTKQEADGDIITYEIVCTLASIEFTERASDRTDDPREMVILEPEEPFDVRRSIRGDKSWETAARYPRAARLTAKRPTYDQQNQPTPGSHRKAPEEVATKLVHRKKKYIVPQPPEGIVFFSSTSKQPLEVGAELYESDDDVDEEWLTLLRNAEFGKMDVSDTRKRFLKKYQDFVGKEGLESDIHLGDTIYRFAHQEAEWIWTASVFDEFQTKLAELLEDELISEEIHNQSLIIVKSKQPNDEVASLSQGLARLDTAPTNTRSWTNRKGKERAVDPPLDSQLTPVHTDSDGDIAMQEEIRDRDSATPEYLPYDQCYCGQDPFSSTTVAFRPAVACSNIDCIRRMFHVDCVEERTGTSIGELDPRQRTWKCPDCTAGGEADADAESNYVRTV